jgi:hypothetical protein
MVAVVAVVVGIVLVLIYRERSRTAGDPPAATTGHSERAADPPAAPTAPERATREARLRRRRTADHRRRGDSNLGKSSRQRSVPCESTGAWR